jgi:hypothetical protein
VCSIMIFGDAGERDSAAGQALNHEPPPLRK